MKTILRFLPAGKRSTLKVFKKKQRLDIPKSKIQKLPAQKTPKVSAERLTEKQIELRSKALGDKSHRMIIGKDSPTTHLGEEAIRGDAIASKLAERKFNRTLTKELAGNRQKIATTIRGMGSNKKAMLARPRKVTPTFRVAPVKRITNTITGETTKNKAGTKFLSKNPNPYKQIKGQPRLRQASWLKRQKDKGGLAAYKKADMEANKLYTKVSERFAGRAKVSSFKTRSKPTYVKLDRREKDAFKQTQESWGFDPNTKPDTSDLMLGGKTNRNFKMKKKKYFYKDGFKIDKEID